MAKTLRDRRLLWPVKSVRTENSFQFPMDYHLRNRCLDWIETHTSGEFYIGPNVLYFCDDKDATAFAICDVLNQIKKKEECI